MVDRTKFAIRLKQCMIESRMKQTELADKLGITHGSIYQWLNGKTVPTAERINRIAEIFGCSKEWLMGEDVPKDKEIKRNASGYTDPTAYAAIKSIEKEGKEMLEIRGIEKTIEKGGIYEYTLQNGSRKYALCMSDDRRNDQRTMAIIILEERGTGIEVICHTAMYANPNRLSYGYVDNFGRFVRKANSEEMKAIEKATIVATGLSGPVVQFVDPAEAEKIKHMIKALKDENEEKENCIESLRKQLQQLSVDYNALSKESVKMCGSEKPANDAALMKVEVERDFYKAQYEKMFAMLLER